MNFQLPIPPGLQERAREFNARIDAALDAASRLNTARAEELDRLSRLKASLETKIPSLERDALLSDAGATLLSTAKARIAAMTTRLEALQTEVANEVTMDGAQQIAKEIFKWYSEHLYKALDEFFCAVTDDSTERQTHIRLCGAWKCLGPIRDDWCYHTKPATSRNRDLFNGIVRRALRGSPMLAYDLPGTTVTENP